jgi:hypothetical protein
MSFFYRRYVPVGERRRLAEKAAAKLVSKTGRPMAPVRISGRVIATTFWGRAWCDNLEAYSDFANRLPRGRTYARNGSVIDLQISAGKVEALVQGSSLYRITVGFETLPAARWKAFKARSAGKVTNLLDLLQGRLSQDILADLTTREVGLFPSPREIKMSCSCPDWAGMCKHVAAVLYGVGARLDEKPELFFTLRGVEVGELISSATVEVGGGLGVDVGSQDPALDGADLGALFGVELDAGPAAVVAGGRSVPKKAPKAAAPAEKKRGSRSTGSTRPRAGKSKTPGPSKAERPVVKKGVHTARATVKTPVKKGRGARLRD